ncbi:hypothetical protein [Pseudomonas rhodesiae]|uniref:hypothetical protein n=1 Tax=Pseudomonas rhodesiae TaxID=76760 RepID=UPI00241D7CF6|nr:hypothetical protein [Pseudomonas rhodesiae]
MNKHTPGPWVIIPGGDEWSSGRIATIEPKPETMVETNYWTVAEVNYRRDEHLSNAKLIAAAPDLLSELEETHAALCFTADYIGYERYKRNAAAIAKATQ